MEFDGKQLQESIARISDLMRQVTNLKVEGKRIEATVTRLRELKEVIGKTTATFEEQVQYDLLLAKMQLAADEERIASEREKIKDDRALVDQHELKVKTEAKLKHNVDSARINIAAKLSGIPAHTEKKTLDERLERATSVARGKLAELNAALLAAAHIKNTGDAIVKRAVPEQFPKLRESVGVVAKALASTNVDRLAGLLNFVVDANRDDVLSVEKLLQLATAFDGIDAGLSQLHNSLVGTEGSVLMAVAAESASLDQRVDAAKKERSELADRKQRLVAGAGNYNRDTVFALSAFERGRLTLVSKCCAT